MQGPAGTRRLQAFAAVSAAVAWAALILQASLTIPAGIANGRSAAGAVVFYFSFFTILTNILVALALSAPLMAPASGIGRFFARPTVNTAIATSIALVGVVYSLLLRRLWNPQGLQRIADMALHDVMPVLFLFYWWIAVPKRGLRWRDAIVFAVYPLVYFACVMVRGALTGEYPYPFIDVGALGFRRALINAVAVLASFIAASLLLIRLGRLGAPSQAGAPLTGADDA